MGERPGHEAGAAIEDGQEVDNLRTWLAFGMLLPAEMKNAVGSGAFLKGYSIVRTAECSPMGFVFPDNREFKPCTDKLQIKGR